MSRSDRTGPSRSACTPRSPTTVSPSRATCGCSAWMAERRDSPKETGAIDRPCGLPTARASGSSRTVSCTGITSPTRWPSVASRSWRGPSGARPSSSSGRATAPGSSSSSPTRGPTVSIGPRWPSPGPSPIPIRSFGAPATRGAACSSSTSPPARSTRSARRDEACGRSTGTATRPWLGWCRRSRADRAGTAARSLVWTWRAGASPRCTSRPGSSRGSPSHRTAVVPRSSRATRAITAC